MSALSLRHRLRMWLLIWQANRLLKRIGRPHVQSEHMIGYPTTKKPPQLGLMLCLLAIITIAPGAIEWMI